MRGIAVVAALLVAGVLTGAARAQDGDPADLDPAPLAERVEVLEQQLDGTKRLATGRVPTVTVSGFIDFGFFVPQGNGAGTVQDLGPAAGRHFPGLADRYAWVFLGDLLAPAVNSRGEPADLGNAPGVDRFDTIHSHGAPGFILNEVNLNLSSALAERALATASVNFAPRSGNDFRLGDSFDLDLAQLEWMPTQSRRTSIFAGKIDSVLGLEYRHRKAHRRFGVTPSLLARYTTEPALGVKVRSKLGDNDWLVLAAALTNGSNGYEAFHFHDELDSNAGKTASARISVAPPLPVAVELGASGAYGSQDRALDSRHALWFAGADAQLHLHDFDLRGEFLIGRGAGEIDAVYEPPHRVYGLRLAKAGYVEAEWMLTPVFGLLGRAELRDALVWLGNPDAPGGGERVYVTKSWRATLGARAAINQHVIVKAEYLHNGEYGGVPAIRNDMFTSSLVLVY
jgi:hypothetical protein